MVRVNQLGYIALEVTDVAGWKTFGTDVLGLLANDSDTGPLRFRMDEYAQRFLVYPGEKDDIRYIGWETADAASLAALGERLENAGVEVTPGTAEEIAERRVSGLLRFRDPSGIESEIYFGALLAYERPFHSPRAISKFVTGDQGLGHIVLAVDDAAASLAFYRDVLGLRESDFISFSRGSHEMKMTFMHCNPRHHSLAFMEAPLPRRLHHIMVQVDSLDDVGSTYSLCSANDVPVASTLGRHTNDHMVSFYMVSPSGFEIEYGWGARTIDDATWKVQTHQAPSIWGHDRSAR